MPRFQPGDHVIRTGNTYTSYNMYNGRTYVVEGYDQYSNPRLRLVGISGNWGDSPDYFILAGDGKKPKRYSEREYVNA